MQRHNTYENNVYTVYVLEFPENHNVIVLYNDLLEYYTIIS